MLIRFTPKTCYENAQSEFSLTMKNHNFILLIVFKAIIQQSVYCNGVAVPKPVREYLIHSYSDPSGYPKLSHNLVEFFSNTTNGEMLQLKGIFDNDYELSMNVDTTKYNSVIILNYTRKEINFFCCVQTGLEFHIIALITEDPQSKIILYGCDPLTSEVLKLYVVESATPDIPDKAIVTLSENSRKNLKYPKATRFDGDCTCRYTNSEVISVDDMKTFQIVGIGIAIMVAMMMVIWIVYEKLINMKNPLQ